MRRLSHRCALCLVVLLLCVACGVPDPPSAAQPPDATPLAADATVAPLPLFPYPPAAVPASPPYPPEVAPRAMADPAFPTVTLPPYPPAELTATTITRATRMALANTIAAYTPTPEPVRTPVAAGPRLREVWPTPARNAPPTQFLYYSERVAEAQTFWRVNLRTLRQRHQLLQVAAQREEWGPLVGMVAPGGHGIAYLRDGRNGYALHVVQRNGQQDQIVAADGLVGWVAPCAAGVAWSPDGRTLAFVQDGIQRQEFDDVLWVTDLHPNHPPQPVADVGWPEFIHWYDATRVLVVTTVDYQRPRQIELVDVRTGTREAIGELPVVGNLTCGQVAPDRQHLVVATLKTGYVVDLRTGQWVTLAIDPYRSVWSVDSQLLLEVPAVGGAPMRLIAPAAPDTSTPVTLMYPYRSTTRFAFQGASPDGQYLVLCTRDDLEPRQARTLLYAVGADRWETLAEGTYCLNMLGWGEDDAG